MCQRLKTAKAAMCRQGMLAYHSLHRQHAQRTTHPSPPAANATTIRRSRNCWKTLGKQCMGTLAPLPAQIIDWRLVLLRDGEKVEQRGLSGSEDAHASQSVGY